MSLKGEGFVQTTMFVIGRNLEQEGMFTAFKPRDAAEFLTLWHGLGAKLWAAMQLANGPINSQWSAYIESIDLLPQEGLKREVLKYSPQQEAAIAGDWTTTETFNPNGGRK